MPQTSDSPSDTDLKRGYTVNAAGEIILLRPLPPGDLSDLFDHHPAQMVNLQVQQVELEIARPLRPAQRSRQSQTPNGYIHLIAWSNACLLRILMTAWFRRYREIHGYNKGFYPEVRLLRPVLSVHAAEERDYGAGRNLEDFRGINSSNSGSASKFLQNPLNSSNFTPAWLNPKLLDRLEAQILDSLRSVIANTEEGHARPTTIEYLTFLGYSQASLIEAKGDGQRMGQDDLLKSVAGSSLRDLKIDLKDWHQALKKSVISIKGTYPSSTLTTPVAYSHAPARLDFVHAKSGRSWRRDYGASRNLEESKGQSIKLLQSPLNSFKENYRNLKDVRGLNSSKFNYPPVDNFNPEELTCEMLIELINKTDWHLRQLVVSLEEKLNQDKQYYLIEQARLRGKINWRK